MAMATSVANIMAQNELEYGGVVRWGSRLPEVQPGIYLVSSSIDPHDEAGKINDYSADVEALSKLKILLPNISIDGSVASEDKLAERLNRFWIPDAAVLYIGLAGTSLQARVGQYYSTKLGARSPHAGGWWLKTMADLDDLYVHFAATNDSSAVEQRMLDAFATSIPQEHSQRLFDSVRIAPFANVEVKKGLRKRHGLKNYKIPKSPRLENTEELQCDASAQETASNSSTENIRTLRVPSQRISAKDRQGSDLRIPAGSDHAFPNVNADLIVDYRGQLLSAKWRPRLGRSSTLGLGRSIMSEIGSTNEPVLLDVTGPRITIVEVPPTHSAPN